MKVTLSILKADIGSIGGHICPSRQLMDAVKEHLAANAPAIVHDYYVSHTGDDVAILFAHVHRRSEPRRPLLPGALAR